MSTAKSSRIIFMGTPEFATTILKKLVETNHSVVACVTVPDKPAGRGRKLNESDVKQYAQSVEIPILQPEKLKDEAFIEQLKSFNADLFIVVAFRMLPKVVWEIPKLGTFNLHGSLLPQYRGAAPINWAVMNGEKLTGVTTFFINENIDTGDILLQKSMTIGENETVGEVHDRMMHVGADLVIETVRQLTEEDLHSQPQIVDENLPLKQAPKLFKQDCLLELNTSASEAHDFIRGLSPYPTAWIRLINKAKGQEKTLKLFRSLPLLDYKATTQNTFIKSGKQLILPLKEGALELLEVQLEGKKRMHTQDFLAGFNIEEWEIVY